MVGKGTPNMESVRFLTYSMVHNKNPVVGSTQIRVEQLLKYWPQAANYKYGEFPDVMIFQKVYCSPGYKFPVRFEGIKILDICDPDWLEGMAVAETARGMDAITVPTKELADFMQQLTDAPVFVVPDRWDVDPKVLPKPKQHKLPAKTVVWYGYSHNADLLRGAMPTIQDLGLKLIVISNDDPLLHRFDMRDPKDFYTFHKYSEDSIYTRLQEADIALLPTDYRPQGRFKSNNKTTRAILAGLPVATTGDELRKLLDPEARTEYMREHYATIKSEYDVRKSVEQYKNIIAQVK